jgi:hypothetical protein
MDPLLPFTSLASHVEHAGCKMSVQANDKLSRPALLYTQRSHGKPSLVDTGRLRSRSQNVGF